MGGNLRKMIYPLSGAARAPAGHEGNTDSLMGSGITTRRCPKPPLLQGAEAV